MTYIKQDILQEELKKELLKRKFTWFKDSNWQKIYDWDKLIIYSHIIKVFKKDWKFYWEDISITDAIKRWSKYFTTDWIAKLKTYNLKKSLLINE